MCIYIFSIFFFSISLHRVNRKILIHEDNTDETYVFFERNRFWKPFIVRQKLTRFELRTGKVYQERGTKKRNGMRREGKREKKGEGRRERKNEYILGGLRDDLRIALLSSLLLASASPTWQFRCRQQQWRWWNGREEVGALKRPWRLASRVPASTDPL